MAKIYFTLTGTAYYHGNDFLEPGMKIKLEKEPAGKAMEQVDAAGHEDVDNVSVKQDA